MTHRLAVGALIAASLVPLFPVSGVAAGEPSPFGLWARGDGKAKVRVARCGADLCATNTWILQGTKGEKAGDVLVMSVKPDDPSHWSGTAFDRQRDLTYRMTLNVGDQQMTTRGCVLAGIICKDMGWTRLKGK
ncbi:DUF2147 domain-containing protein [Pleomorphomonas sp. PLEO]|uniref:DUF2147 domain-containing protein n=1 Tax=Pleomorphomonas sp. PLEO TaxID=3239306 RepID=UPI00351E93BF